MVGLLHWREAYCLRVGLLWLLLAGAGLRCHPCADAGGKDSMMACASPDARTVLRFSEELAKRVINSVLSLDEALEHVPQLLLLTVGD